MPVIVCGQGSQSHEMTLWLLVQTTETRFKLPRECAAVYLHAGSGIIIPSQ